MINLIGNAVKFTDSGSVGFRFRKQGSDDSYLFEVLDTGKGIPLKAQESIFSAFQQDKEGVEKGGTGLGLAISRRLVEQMGGQLSLESVPGKGARFYFSIPLPVKEGKVVRKRLKYKDILRIKDSFKVKAMVVDDVKENRDVLSWFLRDIGVVVTTAEDGRQAVDQIVEDEPDLVFMDIRMPVMDGIESFHEIKKQYPNKDIKIICITASTLYHEQKEYLDMGFDAFIPKPFNPDDILGFIEKFLNVEFDYKENKKIASSQEEQVDIDWSKVKISEEIKTQILESADLYSITRLEEACEQLEATDNGGKELAQFLKQLLKKFDIDGIISAMSKVA